MRSDRTGTAKISRVILQEFVHLVAGDADLMKIMRVVADGAFIVAFAGFGLVAFNVRRRFILATGAFVVGKRCGRSPKPEPYGHYEKRNQRSDQASGGRAALS